MIRRVFLVVAAAVLALAGIAVAAEVLNVKLREATVRSGPKHFKPPVATVKYDEKVEVLEEKDGWLRVRLASGAVGWLHESAVTDEKLAKEAPGGGGTAATAGGSVSRDEVALAGKGFNPQVEAKYREQNPNREAQFQWVDATERRGVSQEDLDRFQREGQLGEYGRQP